METMRINKYLSDAGVCSRREADRMISEGRVCVDGLRAETGQQITPQSRVTVDGRPVKKTARPVLLAVYKPVGVVCTAAKDEPANIVDYVGYPERIYPIGRLDKDSEGLILMTNQGDLANRLMHARGLHEKEYYVTVNRAVTKEFCEKMAAGVRIKPGNRPDVPARTTRPCEVTRLSRNMFRIVLTQGMNRQIRRMCEALDYEVTELKRIRVMSVTLQGLKPGEYRRITGAEYDELTAELEL